MKKIAIIGAGPGGLASGLILRSRGYDVTIYEKNPIVGGRTGFIKMDGYKFDIGPTFLMMDYLIDEVFTMAGKDYRDYMKVKEVDPMYRLVFDKDKELFLYGKDQEKMEVELNKNFKNGYESYKLFLEKEEEKFNKILPALRVPYLKKSDLLRKELRQAIPYLNANINLHKQLGKYYEEENFKLAFTFQAKYLGMSPWECPGTFSIISYIEHSGGIHHVEGGLNEICQGMKRAFEEDGGKLKLESKVDNIIVENKQAKGIVLEDKTEVYYDDIIINSDFAYTMKNLVNEENRKKYSDENLNNKKYSCSIFMMYLGVKKRYESLKHHNIFFAKDYKKNVEEISNTKVLSEDPSVYIQNAIINDETLAEEGKSPLYVLVPVPNNDSKIDWDKEKDLFREKILKILETKAGLKDIKDNIECEKIITPKDWEEDFNVYKGATFNLAHNLGQMLYFRPRNKFEEFDNCYLVGGGTHPGSGLPTILESAKISSKLIIDKYNTNK